MQLSISLQADQSEFDEVIIIASESLKNTGDSLMLKYK